MATWQEMVKNAGGDPTKLGANEKPPSRECTKSCND